MLKDYRFEFTKLINMFFNVQYNQEIIYKITYLYEAKSWNL